MSEATPLPLLPTIEPGRYRHYKGAFYQVLGVVRHSETLEALVLYQPLYGEGALWVRPWSMFTGQVEVEGVQMARFARAPDSVDLVNEPAG